MLCNNLTIVWFITLKLTFEGFQLDQTYRLNLSVHPMRKILTLLLVPIIPYFTIIIVVKVVQRLQRHDYFARSTSSLVSHEIANMACTLWQGKSMKTDEISITGCCRPLQWCEKSEAYLVSTTSAIPCFWLMQLSCSGSVPTLHQQKVIIP